MKRRILWMGGVILAVGLAVVSPGRDAAQERPEFVLEKAADGVYCLYGQGGNIGVLKTGEGFIIVDAQYARSAGAALEKIRELGDEPVLYLVNTHYHGDHTDGNAVIGRGAEIVAHVRCRDSFLGVLKPEESPEEKGTPSRTFRDEEILDLAGKKVRLLHFGPGHTAGDTVVVFEGAGVIHAGDLFFNGMPPYIDVGDGADTANWVKTIGLLAERYPDFRVIPGHGKVADMPEWVRFAEYLKYLRAQVAAAVAAGKTREETVSSVDLSRFAHISDQGGFLTKAKNIEWIYDELTGK